MSDQSAAKKLLDSAFESKSLVSAAGYIGAAAVMGTCMYFVAKPNVTVNASGNARVDMRSDSHARTDVKSWLR